MNSDSLWPEKRLPLEKGLPLEDYLCITVVFFCEERKKIAFALYSWLLYLNQTVRKQLFAKRLFPFPVPFL